MSKLGIPPVPLWTVGWFSVSGSAMSNNEHTFADTNRHLVEVPDSFAIARWPRDAHVATNARCIAGTLKYEPHAADTTVLRQALEGVIEHTARGGTAQTQQETLSMKRTQGQSGDTTTTDEQKTVDKSEMPPSLADVEAEMTAALLPYPSGAIAMSDIIEDLHALKSILKYLHCEAASAAEDDAYEAAYGVERAWRRGRIDMSWQMDWLERYIERLKTTA